MHPITNNIAENTMSINSSFRKTLIALTICFIYFALFNGIADAYADGYASASNSYHTRFPID